MSIVSTKELNLSYGKHHVLKDVSMDIERNYRTDRPVRLRKIYIFENSEPHERSGAGLPHYRPGTI